MKIEIQIGNAIVQVGEPSINHVTFRSTDGFPPTFHIDNWKVAKETIDQMFRTADALNQPLKIFPKQ